MTTQAFTPMTDADIAVRDYRNTVASALSIAVDDLDMRVYRHQSGSSSARDYCSVTTQNGLVCKRHPDKQVGHFTWACRHHANQMESDLAEFIRNDMSVHGACEVAVNLWRRMEADPHVRACIERDLADLFDRVLRRKLTQMWGADE